MHSPFWKIWSTAVPVAVKTIRVTEPVSMIQTPHEFFFEECLKLGVHLPPFGKYGVGVIFFPKELSLREECRDIFNRTAEKLGLEILTWRKVPVNPAGHRCHSTCP